MYVLPEYRGRGIAARVLQELELRARRRGFDAVRLDTNARLGEANGMYRGRGTARSRTNNGNPRSNRWFEKSLREFT